MDSSTATILGDMFSIGCLFHYGLTEGRNLFGDTDNERVDNIKNNKPNFTHLINKQSFKLKSKPHVYDSVDKWRSVVARDLLEAMIANSPAKRPNCVISLLHPCFFNLEKIYQFFRALIKTLLGMTRAKIQNTNLEQQGRVLRVVKCDWKDVIKSDFKNEVMTGTQNVMELLQFIDKHVSCSTSVN